MDLCSGILQFVCLGSGGGRGVGRRRPQPPTGTVHGRRGYPRGPHGEVQRGKESGVGRGGQRGVNGKV